MNYQTIHQWAVAISPQLRHLAFGLACLSLLIMGSCKANRDTAQDGEKLRKRPAKYIIGKLDKYHLDAEWLSAKARVKLATGTGDIKGTAIIRMRKDSVIWASVRKLNIEAARVLVTPDSVYMVNRLAKNYSIQSAQNIRNLLGLSETGDPLQDFRNLYDLILGNPIFLSKKESKVRTQSPNYVLAHKDTNLQTEHWVDGGNYTLHKMKIFQNKNKKEAACTYGDYQKLEDGSIFSYLRTLGMYSVETGRLDATLEFTRISINEPKKIRFEIPDGYQRID